MTLIVLRDWQLRSGSVTARVPSSEPGGLVRAGEGAFSRVNPCIPLVGGRSTPSPAGGEEEMGEGGPEPSPKDVSGRNIGDVVEGLVIGCRMQANAVNSVNSVHRMHSVHQNL